MRILRRISIAFLIFLLLSLAACVGNGTSLSPKTPVTVTLWHYYVGDSLLALEKAVEAFNQTTGLERGVVVDPVAMGSLAELEQNVTASAKGAINSKSMPDIFSCYPDKALEIEGYIELLDFNEYFTEEEKSKFVSDFLQDGVFYGGRFLLLPIVKSTEVLFVNDTGWKEFSAENEISEESLLRWESLYDVSRKYYNWTDKATPDIAWDGKAMFGIDSVANYIIIGNRQLDVEIIHSDKDGKNGVIMDEEALRRIFTIYYQGYSMGYFDDKGKFRSDDVKTNDLIAYAGSSSGASYFPSWVAIDGEKKYIDFLSLPYPTFEGGKEYAVGQGAGMCVVKSDDAHQEGAALFLKWFTGEENNIEFALTTGYMPVKLEAYSSDLFKSAISDFIGGNRAQKILGAVYQTSLSQVKEKNTYSPKPFAGSYDVRILLQKSLIRLAEEGRAAADALKQRNISESVILEGIDTNAAFNRWITALEEGLNDMGIYFERIAQ